MAVFLQGDVHPPWDVWTSATWEGQEELAAATRSTEDGEKDLTAATRSTKDGKNSSHQLLTEVVRLHTEQQQLKHSARAPKFVENQLTK